MPSAWFLSLYFCDAQDPHIGYQRPAGCGEEDGEWWAAGQHLGPSAHGQDRPLSAFQPAEWRAHREVSVHKENVNWLGFVSCCSADLFLNV